MTLITDDPRDAVESTLEDQTIFLLPSDDVQQNNVVPRQEGKGKAWKNSKDDKHLPERT